VKAFLIMAVSVMSFALAGCEEVSQATSGSGVAVKGKTQQEIALEAKVKSLNQQSRNIVARNTIEGALVGAAAGCVLAELTGRKCAQGALIGGVAGGVGGNIAGQKAAAANKKLVNQREIIANLSGMNKELNSIEGNLKRVVASQNAEIKSLRRQLSNKQVSQAQYSNRVRAINSNRSVISSSLLQTEKNVAASTQKLVSLEAQSGTKLTTEKRATTGTKNRVARLRSSVSLAKIN
jgi:hypothetical protein